MESPASEQELRELVRRYRVIWDTRPEMAQTPGDNSVTPVGYVVELGATPDHPEHPLLPDCAECRSVTQALERLAQVVSSNGAQSAPVEVHVGRDRVQIDPSHESRPELAATITIVPAGPANRPLDADRKERLAEIVRRLRELGVQEQRWRDDGGR